MALLHANDKVVLGAVGAVFAAALAYGASQGGVLLPLVAGSLIVAASVVLALLSRGGAASQIGLPVLGMAMVGLAIHAARGQAESHFAVFSFLAATSIYRHWRAVVAGAATIALHHLSFNAFQQWGWGAVCFTEPGLGHVMAHAAYVVAEAALLLLMVQRAVAQDRGQQGIAAITERLLASEAMIDLRHACADATREPVARRLIDALQRIEHSVVLVRSSADSIGGAATEIARGNAELRQRTERAASSLQQTASAMDELNGTVRQTADSARTANQLASSASSVAQRGGQVVAQVVATMNDINTSSNKIADIIGTIDGIAFQTNILALNAAVEAARAGEQGRGFAVVASEVRSLAQRSAEAAREIKILIGASVDKVESGSRLVANAGSTMTEIVASVQRVSDIIGEISAAAAEQSNGIGQVNHAVAQLDQTTQQNAALVEQSAAAAASLKDQSRQMADVVAAFRTSGAAAGLSAGSSAGLSAGPSARASAGGSALLAAPARAAVAAPAPGSLAHAAIAQARAPAPARHGARTAATRAAAAAAAAPAAPAVAAGARAAGADDDWESF